MKTIYFSKMLLVVTGLLTTLSFQNCSDVAFDTQEQVASSCSPDPADDCHQSTETLRKIQPAVAVRGISCLMCHAQVRSNIITDFGHGSSWYFGGGKGFETQSWFTNLVNTWQSARGVTGSVIVPVAVLPEATQRSVTEFASRPPMSIKQAMMTPYKLGSLDYIENPAPGGAPMEMTYYVTPPAGQQKVIEKGQILITSPSEEEIAALAPRLWQNNLPSGVTRVGSAAPTQLFQRGSGSGTFTMNGESAELQCAKANIVVKGTLYLRNLRVNAAGGCRLYVSGSVFIENAITYAPGTDSNLQITSANGIFLGLNTGTLAHRLIDDSRDAQIDGPRSYESRARQAVVEAEAIGELRDSKVDNGGAYKSINFSGLLLNAPMIHSRYLGEFKGTIVAQLALFILGEFHFVFDPVFTRVNAFPLLKKPILIAK